MFFFKYIFSLFFIFYFKFNQLNLCKQKVKYVNVYFLTFFLKELNINSVKKQ